MTNSASKLVNNKQLETASAVIRALAHPLRLKLIAFIDENKRINVNKIYKSLKLEQSIASQHLRILRDQKLVLSQRDGKFIFYSVNYDKIAQVADAVDKFFKT
jgi:ArsR family transcriptional regulator